MKTTWIAILLIYISVFYDFAHKIVSNTVDLSPIIFYFFENKYSSILIVFFSFWVIILNGFSFDCFEFIQVIKGRLWKILMSKGLFCFWFTIFA